jgi:hypothetical protein
VYNTGDLARSQIHKPAVTIRNREPMPRVDNKARIRGGDNRTPHGKSCRGAVNVPVYEVRLQILPERPRARLPLVDLSGLLGRSHRMTLGLEYALSPLKPATTRTGAGRERMAVRSTTNPALIA